MAARLALSGEHSPCKRGIPGSSPGLAAHFSPIGYIKCGEYVCFLVESTPLNVTYLPAFLHEHRKTHTAIEQR